MDKPTIMIEELLPMLRKHGVSEYNSDQFGVRIKFEPTREVKVYAQSLVTKEQIEASRVEPAGPEMGHIEVVRHDLEDVLFGAK